METDVPGNEQPTENGETAEKGQRVASFLVRVNIWGDAVAPTAKDLAGMVQREVQSTVTGSNYSVTTSAERIDK